MEKLKKIEASYFGTKKLKQLLQLVNKDLKAGDLMQVFKAIAKSLLCEVRIRKDSDAYDILEVEFYYQKGKEWKVAYPRKAKAGDWFFHSYGMDLCFESDYETPDNPFYGGILIRSIKSCSDPDAMPIIGSGRVCDTLFSVYNAFDNIGYEENMPYIIGKDEEFRFNGIVSTYRYHIEDARHGVKENLRFTTADFQKYKEMGKTKSWTDYFDRRHLGCSRKEAEKMIKEDCPKEKDYDFRAK